MTTQRDREPDLERNWDRKQWEGEGQDTPPGDETPEAPEAASWNKHQWEGEGQDDVPQELEDPTQDMEEGESEFSGHGHNPGGGQGWANVDRD